MATIAKKTIVRQMGMSITHKGVKRPVMFSVDPEKCEMTVWLKRCRTKKATISLKEAVMRRLDGGKQWDLKLEIEE